MPGNKCRVCQKGCSLPSYLHNSKGEYTVAILTNITHSLFTLPFICFFFLLFLLNVSPLAFSPHLNAESLPLQDIFWLQPPPSFRWRQTTVCVITATNKASCLNQNVAWCRISSWTAVNSVTMFNYAVADWINHEVPLHIFHIEGNIFFICETIFCECVL